LNLVHEIDILYLQGKFDDKTYRAKSQELKKNESKEASDNIKSWITKNESNPWPKMPIPNLMYEKRNSSQSNSKALFVISGLLLVIFSLVDILKWRKGRRQPKKSIQENQPPTSLLEQIIYNGQTLTRLPGNDGKGEKTEVWEDQNGHYVEVPNADIEAREKAKASFADNTMEFDDEGKKKILERQKATNEEGETFDSWIDENGMPVDVPEEVTAAWDAAKAIASSSNTVISA